MVQVPHCRPPVVVSSDLAVPPARAQQETLAHQDEAGGVAHHVGVVGPVGETVRPVLVVQTLLHGPEDQVSVIISSDQPAPTSLNTVSTILTYRTELKSTVLTLFSSLRTLRQFPSWI